MESKVSVVPCFPSFFRSRFAGFFILLFALPSLPLVAQSAVKLPLPVDSPANALFFEAPAPTAAVLTGVLLPSFGPLTAWAPVWSTLRADGSLKETAGGSWTGPLPDRWLQVVKPGYVVGGFRFLIRTGPGGVQIRQAQVFWKPWVSGEAKGELVASRVYGQAAGEVDTVRIIELTLPPSSVPTGLYGQTVAGQVAQVSLLVRQSPAPEAAPVPARPSPSGPSSPEVPAVAPVPLLN